MNLIKRNRSNLVLNSDYLRINKSQALDPKFQTYETDSLISLDITKHI